MPSAAAIPLVVEIYCAGAIPWLRRPDRIRRSHGGVPWLAGISWVAAICGDPKDRAGPMRDIEPTGASDVFGGQAARNSRDQMRRLIGWVVVRLG